MYLQLGQASGEGVSWQAGLDRGMDAVWGFSKLEGNSKTECCSPDADN